MFINASTHTFTVPGNTELVTVRKLTRKQLRKAVQARAVTSIDVVRNLGGAAVVRELQELEENRKKIQEPPTDTEDPPELDAAAKQEAALDAEVARYDEDAILALGVVGFSPVPIDATLEDLLESLEADAATFIARETIAFTKGLRVDVDAEKND